MTESNEIKAGKYELVAKRWDKVLSKPGEPFDFKRYRQGDVVALNIEDARRLVLAGAVKKPGEPDGTPVITGPSVAPGGSADPPLPSIEEDPSAHNIKPILDHVGEDAARAAVVLEKERARGEDARTTLVTRLEEIATAPPTGGEN